VLAGCCGVAEAFGAEAPGVDCAIIATANTAVSTSPAPRINVFPKVFIGTAIIAAKTSYGRWF